MSVGLAPGLAFSATGEDLALAASRDTLTTVVTQASKAPKITVTRAATGKVAIKKGKAYKLGAKTTAGKLSYKSSNKKVATVTSKGIVRAKKAGKTYRALVQCGTTAAGNCGVTFKVCDLETGKWTKLISYDLGYKDTGITSLGCFLENYLREQATEVRTAEWSNFRVKSRENSSWVAAKSAKMERQFETWPGSYSFGSDGSCFWAITSGVPKLCKPPANGTTFKVSKAKGGRPY